MIFNFFKFFELILFILFKTTQNTDGQANPKRLYCSQGRITVSYTRFMNLA